MSRSAASPQRVDFFFLLTGVVLVLIFTAHYHSLSSINESGGLRSKISNVLYTELTEDIESLRKFQRREEALLNQTYERFTRVRLRDHSQREAPSATVSTSSAENSHGQTGSGFVPQDLSCPHGNLVQFWRRPTPHDLSYTSPFASIAPDAQPKYVTFEPDVGGWNNIRMQMETVLVFAASTGRILVLPPDQPMYLLNKGKGHHNEHSFADFFPFDYIQHMVRVITMDEFLLREAVTGRLRHAVTGLPTYPPGNVSSFRGTIAKERNVMWDYLRNATTCPPWKCMREYLVIPRFPGFNASEDEAAAEYAKRQLVFAGDPKFGMTRTARVYDAYWHTQKVIHFISKPGSGHRLLQHYYTFLHFQDSSMDRLYKRFVRDFVHYIPLIHCKAASIIARLLEAGNGTYSSWHVRRGEFQYKETRLPADQLLANVGHLIPQNEVLFIATDEHDKSFFQPFRTRFPKIFFLDDFTDLAGLSTLNPNYLGMIDQVVCTRGRQFMGTWFSTFTGYITRMRGYHGLADNSTRYTDLKHRDRFQGEAELPRFPFYMREFPLAWRGIDEG